MAITLKEKTIPESEMVVLQYHFHLAMKHFKQMIPALVANGQEESVEKITEICEELKGMWG